MVRDVHDFNETERAAHVAAYGQGNDFPPNWREVTEAEIVRESMWRIYSPVLREYRQMGKMEVGGVPLLGATLHYFHDGSGVGMAFDYEASKVRWFRFHVCAHALRETSRPAGHRSGLHTYECTLCGYQTALDTSD